MLISAVSRCPKLTKDEYTFTWSRCNSGTCNILLKGLQMPSMPEWVVDLLVSGERTRRIDFPIHFHSTRIRTSHPDSPRLTKHSLTTVAG